MNSNVNRHTQTIPANGIIALAPANYFFLETASLGVTLRFQGDGNNSAIGNVTAGILHGRVIGWKRAVIEGAAGTVVSWYYGDAELREDITDFRSQLIGGVTSVSNAATSTMTSTARAALASGAHVDIAANPLRKRLSISNWSSGGGGTVCVRDQAATADAGDVLESGQTWSEPTAAAIRIRNNSGTSADISYQEHFA